MSQLTTGRAVAERVYGVLLTGGRCAPRTLGLACLILLLWPLAMAAAQDASGTGAEDAGEAAKTDAGPPPEGGDDLRAKAQNPVANMISLPFENSLDFGAPDGSAYFLNIQPVIPFTVGDWNFINRTIVPIIRAPGELAGLPGLPEGGSGSGSVWGLGDINHTTFLSPAKPGPIIWGVGPSIQFPSATSSRLGTGKWAAGPSAVFITQPAPWSIALLVRQMWSFAAAKSDRDDVSQFVVQPFINYNLDDGWYLVTEPAFTANWAASRGQRWTVPIGGGFGRLFKIGEQPINIRLQGFKFVEKPDNAPDWVAKLSIALLFPK